MKIRDRLALNFSLISSAVLFGILSVIYLSSYSLLKSDFYDHLNDRAKVAGQLYLEADEISSDSLEHVRDRFLAKLPSEQLGIYDEKNKSFISNQRLYWSKDVLEKVREKKHLEFSTGRRQTVGIYYIDNQGNFVILVSAISKQNYKRLHTLLQIMIVLFIVVNGMFFFVGRWFAKRSLMPIQGLIRQMQLIKVNNLHLRVEEGKGKDEITELARYFNRLLEHLQNAFELQQAFVTNASHELRTPVTSIIGEVEITLNKPRPPEEYQHILNSVLSDAIRLNETITSLMELAQTDMEYTRARQSPVKIDDLIWESYDYWTKLKGSGKLIIDIKKLPDDESKLEVNANKSLLGIAFNNIIGNAFKFSNNQPVVCSLYADGEIISVEIRDNGIGIPPEDIQRVFTSFYRSPNGRSFQGSGIGLYVTQKIIHLFNGVIEISSEKNKGTAFIVRFQAVN
jgi:signal transduction histidine kinase